MVGSPCTWSLIVVYGCTMSLPSSKKTHSERHKQILLLLLKEDANKTCADCKTARHPRWASWNLGCFVCIRCLGIHRSMGTHISRVKLVDLDAWTDEQVQLMVKWGNERCNAHWEAKLPEGYVPDGLKIENFIRTKYDLKKWAEEFGAFEGGSAKTGKTPRTEAQKTPKTEAKTAQYTASLLDLASPSITNAPPAPAPAPKPAQEAAQAPVPARTDLKKSILSLYLSPASSSSSVRDVSAQFSGLLVDQLSGRSTPAYSQPFSQPQYTYTQPLTSKIELDDELFKNVWN